MTSITGNAVIAVTEHRNEAIQTDHFTSRRELVVHVTNSYWLEELNEEELRSLCARVQVSIGRKVKAKTPPPDPFGQTVMSAERFPKLAKKVCRACGGQFHGTIADHVCIECAKQKTPTL